MIRTNDEISFDLSCNESMQFDLMTQLTELYSVWDFDTPPSELPFEPLEHLLELFQFLSINRMQRDVLIAELLLKDAYVI